MTATSSADRPAVYVNKDATVSDGQRRETLTGAAGAMAAMLSREWLHDELPISPPIGDNLLLSTQLTAELLEGDTIVRNLWLNRLAYPVLVVALEMGLFEALKQGRLNKTDLCHRLSPPLTSNGRTLEAIIAVLASLGLLEVYDTEDPFSRVRTTRTIALTPAARTVLLRDSPHYWGHQLLAADGLTASLRRAVHRDEDSSNHRVVSYAAHSKEQILSFIDSMQSHGSVTALATARALENILGPTAPNPARHILDMAGGSGCFIEAMRDAYSENIQLTLVDIPPVVEKYRDQQQTLTNPFFHKEKSALGSVIAAPGDLFQTDTWPIGPDVHLLANVLHDWDRDPCLQILCNSREALNKSASNGRLVVVEQLLDETQTGPLPAALASVSMLLGDWRSGKEYSYQELETMILSAGFKSVELGPSCGNFHSAIVAYA